MESINIDKLKYYKPLHKINDIVKDLDGVNFIIVMADAKDPDVDENSPGGQIMHIEVTDDGRVMSPTPMELIGNLIQMFLKERDMSYRDKIKWMNNLSENVILHITNDDDVKEFNVEKGEK